MSSSLRRLAKDHGALRKSLPPNYLFDDDEGGLAIPDELNQVIIWVTGADGTPYSQGLWRLKLSIPPDYPRNPPKAVFITRIFHPNVEEETGAVCLETLKRDWDPKLTLKDILITISCLLIQPNPDSALNAKAGSLIQEDYEAFAKQARLMTSIHAPIPKHLKALVLQAKKRGEDPTVASVCTSSIINSVNSEQSFSQKQDDTKENSISSKSNIDPSKVAALNQESSRKRPLAEIPSELVPHISEDDIRDLLPGADQGLIRSNLVDGERPRKSPKHTHIIEDQKQKDRSENHPQSEDHESSRLTEPSKTSIQSTEKSVDYLKRDRIKGKARVGIRRL